jgi:hypothetical protein
MRYSASFFRALYLATAFEGLLVSAHPSPRSSAKSATDYAITVVEEFPNPTWLENVATRHNGLLLVTSLSNAHLYQVDPSGVLPTILVADIPGANGLLGIAELERDVFYVIAGNATPSETSITFPSKVWKVDVGRLSVTKGGIITRPAQLSQVADFPDSLFLNGMCRLSPKNNSYLLLSDSVAGSVISLNVKTGAYTTVIQDQSMSGQSNFSVAINGIHVHGTDLFYTNLVAGKFFKVPISLTDGKAIGPATVVYNNVTGDDFVLSKDGRKAWITTNAENTLVEVDIRSGTGRVVAGSSNNIDLATSTGVAFGRTKADSNSLYVVTTGGVETPFGGVGLTGGRVVRIDLPSDC